MNDLDVILATVEELRGYLWMKRKCGRAACVRRIQRLRKDLEVKTISAPYIHGVGLRWTVIKK